jgi:uncharacterized membrane protein
MDYKIFFLPLGAFWIYFNCMMSSAKLLNEMRDNISIGEQGSCKLSIEHRRIMLHDWKLMMIGAIICSFLFAIILIHISLQINHFSAIVSLLFVAIAPVLGGILFCFCIKKDLNMMKQAIEKDYLDRFGDKKSE